MLRPPGALAALGVLVIASTAEAVVDVNKSFTPINIQPGQTSIVTIELINSAGVPATGASLLDLLPAGVTVVSLGANTCGGSWTSPAAGQLALTGGTVPAASGTVSGICQASATVASTLPGTYVNTIAAGDLGSSEGSNPQAANATLTVSPVLRLTGTKVFTPNVVHGNGLRRFVITLNNPNPALALTGVSFLDNFPTQLVVGSPVFTATTCSGLIDGRTGVAGAFGPPSDGNTAIRLTGGTIPAGGSCTVSVDVRPTNPNAVLDANVTNTLAVGAVTSTQGSSNAAAISGVVRVQTAAQVVKAFTPATITAGGTSTVTLTLRNYNLTPITPAAITDVMPAGVSVVAGTAATTCGGSANTTATTVVLTGGTIPPATNPAATGFGSCTLTAQVTAAAAGTYNNTITAGNLSGVAYAATTALLTVNPVGAVGVSKAFLPTAAPETGTTTLTITLTKAAPGAAAITSFTDNLLTMGAGITIAAAPAAATTCGGTVSAPPGGTLISKTDGTIPAGGSCTITVPLVVASTTTISTRTNTIPAGALVTSAGSNTFAAAATFTVVRAAGVSKAFAPATVGPGQTSRLMITISHANGAVAFSNMGLTDPLPAGHTVAATPGVTNTCGGAVTALSGATAIVLVGGGLPTGATSCAIGVTVQAPAGTGTATNSIPANTLTTAQGVTYTLAASANLTRTIAPGVTLNKGFAPVSIAGGAPSTLSLIVANNQAGAVNLSSVALSDTFPAGMQVFGTPAATFTGAGCSGAAISAVPGAPQVSFTGASITAGSVCTLSVQVTSIVDGNLVNDVPVGALTSAQGASNLNAPSATLTVQRNVNVTKFFTPPVMQQGGTSALTIRIINTNTSLRTGAAPAVVDTLPVGISVAAGAASTTCAGGLVLNGAGLPLMPGDTTVRLDGGVFPSGGTCDVVVPVTGAAAGLYTNTIPAGAIATLEGGSNNLPAVAELRIVQQPTIGKAFAPATILPGGTTTITFTLTNANAAALLAGGLTGASFTDTLVNMAILAPGPAGGTCAGAASNSFSAGQTALSFTGLTIPPASTCTVTVGVTSSAVGVHPNTTSGVSTGQTQTPGPPSNTPTLAVLGPPTMAKMFSPSTVATGLPSALIVVITNPNAATALVLASPAFTDPLPALPAQMTLASPAVSNTCGGVVEGRVGVGAFGPLAIGQTEVRLSGGTVPAGGACSVTVSVVAPAAGTYVNTTSPVATTNSGVSAAGASASLVVEPQADLQITKIGTPSPYVPGAALTYTVVATNAGPSAVTGARVQDTLPVPLASFTWTCAPSAGAACSTGAGTGSFDVLVTLPVGGMATFVVTGTVPAAAIGTLVNTASAAVPVGVTDPDLSNNTATTSTPSSLQADLAVSKSSTPSPYVPGLPLTYTMVVSNLGPSDVAGARLLDTLPVPLAAFTWTCAPTGGGTCGLASGTGSIDTLLTLPSGTSVTFTVTGTVPSSTSGALINTATIAPSAGTADPVPGNNVATDASPAGAIADLAITKASTPNPYVPGLALTYTIIVSNAGPSDVVNARVQDALPSAIANFTWTCTPGASATCGTASGVGNIDALVSLAVGASATFVVSGTVPPGAVGTLVNTATISGPAGTTDPVPGNNTASDANATNLVADLAIVKTSVPNPYLAGAPLTYTIVVSNAGPGTAVDARVQDALPLPLRAFAWTCVGAAGGTCGTASGSGDIDALVTVPPGGTTTFSVTGIVPLGTSSPLTNTATVAPPPGTVDPTPGNRISSVVNTPAPVTVPGGAELVLTQTFPPSVAAGGVATFVYTSTNRGPGSAIDLMIDGMIPAGTSVASVVPSPGGVVSFVNGMLVVTWAGPTQPGQSRTVTVNLQVAPTVPPGAIVASWFMTSSNTTDPYLPNNMVDSYVFVQGGPSADLALAGVVQAGAAMGAALPVRVGQTALVRLAVTNAGGVPSRGLYALMLDEPGTVQIVGATASSGALAATGPASGSWDTGDVPAGATVTLQLEVRVQTSRATKLQVMRVNGVPTDPNALNDWLELTIDGIGAAPLSGRAVAVGNIDGATGREILVATGRGETPQIQLFAGTGAPIGVPYYTFDRNFSGGLRLAACDVDGDGRDEIVAGQGLGGGDVRVIGYAGGVFTNVVTFTPFEAAFAGGVDVACADLDGDGRGNVVVGAGVGRSPDVRVFAVVGATAVQTASFTAYESSFGGGVRVSTGPVPTSLVGPFSILTTPGPGRSTELVAWQVAGATATAVARAPLGGAGGAFTAIGDSNNDGVLDVAVMPDGGEPTLLTLIGLAAGNTLVAVPAGTLGFTGGMQAAIGDLGLGVQEIVVVDGPGALPRVQVLQLNAAGGGLRRLGFLALEVP